MQTVMTQVLENVSFSNAILYLNLNVELSPPDHLAECAHPFIFLSCDYDSAPATRHFEKVLVTLENTSVKNLLVKKNWIDNLVKAGWQRLTDKGEGVDAAVFIKGSGAAAILLDKRELTWTKISGTHELLGEYYYHYKSNQGHNIYVQERIVVM